MRPWVPSAKRATLRGAERTSVDGERAGVLVCGASFAGLAVARELAGLGHDVLLLDRYEIGERQTSACAVPTPWLDALGVHEARRAMLPYMRYLGAAHPGLALRGRPTRHAGHGTARPGADRGGLMVAGWRDGAPWRRGDLARRFAGLGRGRRGGLLVSEHPAVTRGVIAPSRSDRGASRDDPLRAGAVAPPGARRRGPGPAERASVARYPGAQWPVPSSTSSTHSVSSSCAPRSASATCSRPGAR